MKNKSLNNGMVMIALTVLSAGYARAEEGVAAKSNEIPASALQDLTGMWRIRSLSPSEPRKSEFVLQKSPIMRCLDVACESKAQFYQATTAGVPVGKWNLVGLNVDHPRKGHPTIRYARIRSANAGNGSELDGEFTMILRYENVDGLDRFYLGGDFEETEYAVLERVSGWSVNLVTVSFRSHLNEKIGL